jgi:hypothetical protein
VFPAKYELNSYIVFRKRLVSKRLSCEEGSGYNLLRTVSKGGTSVFAVWNRWVSLQRKLVKYVEGACK